MASCTDKSHMKYLNSFLSLKILFLSGAVVLEYYLKMDLVTEWMMFPMTLPRLARNLPFCCRFYKNNGVSYKLCSKVGYLKRRFFRQDLVHCPEVNGAIMQIFPERHPCKEGFSIAAASALFNPAGGAVFCKCMTDYTKSFWCFCQKMAGFVHLGATKVEVLTHTAPTVCQRLMIYLKKHIMMKWFPTKLHQRQVHKNQSIKSNY